MIVVKVELWSAVNGRTTELARMMIHNTGCNGAGTRGHYAGEVYKGRDADALHKAMVARKVFKRGEVKNHARLSEHVWNLVAKMLANIGYGGGHAQE